jgi:hypothetical protein
MTTSLEFVKGRTFTRENFNLIIGLGGGKLDPLPNAETVDPIAFLNSLAAGGHHMQPVWGYALLPDGSRNQWTQFFLTTHMGHALDGGGYAVTYGSQVPIVRRFAICKHQKESTGTIEEGRRGWHPGYCKLCGFNMTYDSGD